MFKKIYIEITNLCNKNCSFCSPMKRKKEEMSVEHFEHILKEIKTYTNYIYLHVKGEPLLHSHLKEILELCKKYKFEVNITTNGTLLKDKLSILLESPIRQINVSLHSFEEEKNYMEDILEVTDTLLSHTNTYVNYRFWALENGTFSTRNFDLIQKIETHYGEKFLTSFEKKGKHTLFPHLFLEKGELFCWPTLFSTEIQEVGTCYGLRTHLGILVDGTVVPCCLDADGIINLGNIFEESFSSILSKEKTKKIKEGFQNQKLVEELCKHCSYRNRF